MYNLWTTPYLKSSQVPLVAQIDNMSASQEQGSRRKKKLFAWRGPKHFALASSLHSTALEWKGVRKWCLLVVVSHTKAAGSLETHLISCGSVMWLDKDALLSKPIKRWPCQTSI